MGIIKLDYGTPVKTQRNDLGDFIWNDFSPYKTTGNRIKTSEIAYINFLWHINEFSSQAEH